MSGSGKKPILDATAVLAIIQEEAGAERLLPLCREAAVSAVNVAEVLAKLISKGVPRADSGRKPIREIQKRTQFVAQDIDPARVPLRPERARRGAMGERAGPAGREWAPEAGSLWSPRAREGRIGVAVAA